MLTTDNSATLIIFISGYKMFSFSHESLGRCGRKNSESPGIGAHINRQRNNNQNRRCIGMCSTVTILPRISLFSAKTNLTKKKHKPVIFKSFPCSLEQQETSAVREWSRVSLVLALVSCPHQSEYTQLDMGMSSLVYSCCAIMPNAVVQVDYF